MFCDDVEHFVCVGLRWNFCTCFIYFSLDILFGLVFNLVFFFFFFSFFFFQAEDGIRDRDVTGVQTCALPIYRANLILVSCLTVM